jgi:SAM-dependent methyltransferase
LLDYTRTDYMQGMLLDKFLHTAALARRSQRVQPPPGTVKLNIGAGLEVAQGWINVDGTMHALAARMPESVLSSLYKRAKTVSRTMSRDEYVRRLRGHAFVFHNLQYGLPFESAIADFIFCSHVLEHFHRADAEKLLREMHRVLKPGGRVRIAVPDLARAVALYVRGAKAEALEYFFPDAGAGCYDQHRSMYDYGLMAALLEQIGFVDVVECSFREGTVPDLDKLDNRPEQTLFVEAVKAR